PRALHPDIHIEYPTPSGYQEQPEEEGEDLDAGSQGRGAASVPAGLVATYSEGIGPKWLLRLGRFGEFCAKLRSNERALTLRI
ncbi:MAG: hypothetical protein KAX19_02430, partial [Candidatus Brocadiae bacterium]|nr:hypothetical protein [Candidatus Brocadiia bacterium]